MKRRAANSPTDLIIRRTIMTSELIAGELREKLAERLAAGRLAARSDVDLLEEARRILAEYEPLLAELISNSDLYCWIAGYQHTAQQSPTWLLDLLRRPGKPPGPPMFSLPSLIGDGDEPELRFPILDKAFDSLVSRDILTRPQYDLLDADAKQRAFTVAYLNSTETIDSIREILAEDIQEGTSLRSFRKQIEEKLNGSPIGPAHLETVYRTNAQSAFRDGRESLANHPIIRDVFPYQEYQPIGDTRVRPEHEVLGSLGLDGTGVYRRDDPVWDSFTPPWGYNCRCSVNLLTIEAAARKGVKEAQRWQETGQVPIRPEWRIDHIPFRPEPGFGTRGIVTLGIEARRLARQLQLWDEDDHPRNAEGEFVEKDEAASKKPKTAPPAASTSRQHVTETPEFKAWFGQSKIVDSKGRPRVVYTGQPAGLEEIPKTERSEFTLGHAFFTTSKKVAAQYAGTDDEEVAGNTQFSTGRKGEVYHVFLSIANPMDADQFDEDEWAKHLLPDIDVDSDGYTNRDLAEALNLDRITKYDENTEKSVTIGYETPNGGWLPRDFSLDEAAKVLWKERSGSGDTLQDAIAESPSAQLFAMFPEAAVRYAEAQKFDGILFRDAEMGGITIVPFSANQIKSATGNQGTFDPSNPSIKMAGTAKSERT